MRASTLLASLAAAIAMATAFAAAPATEDVFAFIPAGGRTLLAQVLDKAPPAEVRGVTGSRHASDEWLTYLGQHESALAGLKALDAKQRRTLADYLAHHMPLPPGKAAANASRAAWEKALPPDGRDLVLDYCQSCHIITVVVTQDRAKAAWLGTLNKPSHVGIKLTKEQRDELADYLVVNAAIPIDQVPEDLRAGGATY